MIDLIITILVATMATGTAYVLTGLGELVTEKSGVLNLGAEGMMLMGAIAAFVTLDATGSAWLAMLAGVGAGMLMSLIFAFVALTLRANQVATGLALAIFGFGLSAFIGKNYESTVIVNMKPVGLPGLESIPTFGKLFVQTPIVWLSLVLFALITWFLYKTKAGLTVRAVGESPESAHAIGYPVIAIRYACTLFGGAMAGLSGAYMSTVYNTQWVEGITAGRGWIALALVVFATWRPARVLLGAYLFGGITMLQFQAQGLGINLPAELLSALPYLATIIVLVLISRDHKLIRLNAPASLNQPFMA